VAKFEKPQKICIVSKVRKINIERASQPAAEGREEDRKERKNFREEKCLNLKKTKVTF